jgi:hypothetical protein
VLIKFNVTLHHEYIIEITIPTNLPQPTASLQLAGFHSSVYGPTTRDFKDFNTFTKGYSDIA